MSILIKGAKMPKTCSECDACRFDAWKVADRCYVTGEFLGELDTTKERAKSCPLVEIPSHGRLIDADRLHDEVYDQAKFKRDPVTGDCVARMYIRISEMLRRINDQPTVIVESEEK